MILIIFAVFATCMIIDLIRRGIYDLLKKIPIVYKLIEKINYKFDKINEKVNNFIS